MKWINTLLFVCCSYLLTAQQDSSSKGGWFSLDVFVPDAAYTFQRIKQANFPSQVAPLYLEDKLNLIDIEFPKVRISFFDQISLGAQLLFTTSPKKKNVQEEYENSIPDKHLSNWNVQRMINFCPRIFIGYRYPYKKTNQKTRSVGLTMYLNFDQFNYGSYSYDAKNVNDNQFYHYNLQTKTAKSQSVTFEIDHSTKYHRTKFTTMNPGSKIRLGIRAGFTPRSQTVQFIETFRSLSNTTTNDLAPLRFRSWSLHLGLYLSFETSR